MFYAIRLGSKVASSPDGILCYLSFKDFPYVLFRFLLWISLVVILLLLILPQRTARSILKIRTIRLDCVLLGSGIIGDCINSIAVLTEWYQENIYFFTLIYLSLIFLIGDILKALRDSPNRASAEI